MTHRTLHSQIRLQLILAVVPVNRWPVCCTAVAEEKGAEPVLEKMDELKVGGGLANGTPAPVESKEAQQSSWPPPAAPDDDEDDDDEDTDDETARQKREAELKEIHAELAKEDPRCGS
jgi:hypothetical protein